MESTLQPTHGRKQLQYFPCRLLTCLDALHRQPSCFLVSVTLLEAGRDECAFNDHPGCHSKQSPAIVDEVSLKISGRRCSLSARVGYVS